MPNKTIYVSDSDLPLYDRAAELAGSLSSAVTTALKSFVDNSAAAEEGFEQVSVNINKDGVRSTKRFLGRRLCRVITRDGSKLRRFTAYTTRKAKIAVIVREDPDIVGLLGKMAGSITDPQSWNDDWSATSKQLMIFDSVEDAKEDLPGDVLNAIRASLETPRVEDLDI